MYQESDGTKWFTDHRIHDKEFKFIGKYGRPTASTSCIGTNDSVLERRAEAIMPIVNEYALHYDVDARMIKAIIAVESCFDTHAVSRVGAKGLMQLMPKTAETLGVFNVFNARQNIRGGADYFSQMLVRFDYDTKLALAAYNAGPTAVDKYKGIPPYRETQGYVKKVLAYYEKYQEIQEESLREPKKPRLRTAPPMESAASLTVFSGKR